MGAKFELGPLSSWLAEGCVSYFVGVSSIYLPLIVLHYPPFWAFAVVPISSEGGSHNAARADHCGGRGRRNGAFGCRAAPARTVCCSRGS
jgi:hypothetical protein